MKYKESIEMLIIVEHDDHYDYHDHGEEEEWESLEQQLLLVVAEHREPSPPSQGWQSWCWWQVARWWSQRRWRQYPWDYLATDIDAALCFYPEFMNQLRIFLNNILTVSWNQDSETGEKYFTCNYFSPAFIFHLLLFFTCFNFSPAHIALVGVPAATKLSTEWKQT